MPAPATLDAFVEVLQKSGLVDAERLRPFVPPSSEAPDTPRKLAARLIAAGLLTHFQAEQLLLGKHKGFSLGKYRILERIGAGGHSTVYLGEHMVVKRRVAIKVLPTGRSDNPAAVARFYREARAAGALDHPNLVKAHDIDEDNGLHFLVMEYVDGSSLQEMVARGGPLPIERAAHYISQAALGLQAAYASGLVHRDIKPANILLDRRGVVRVLDLGLARFHCDENDPLTIKFENNNVLGTADYVAPEQALNSHEVDVRADIYSLGATFYFLLTGQPLFPTGKATQKLIWHQTRQPTPLRELRPEVPEELAHVVERMIEKDRDKRYQTPAEVMEALAPWTATPIAPPSEEEMPRLSLAARAAGTMDGEGSLNAVRGPRSGSLAAPTVTNFVLPPPPTLSAPARSVSRSRTMADMPTPPVLAEQNDTHRGGLAAPPPVRKPAPEPAAAAKPETPPEVVPLKATKRRRSLTPLSSRLASTTLLLLIGTFTGAGIRVVINQSAEPAPAPASDVVTLLVSHAPEHYPSIAAALSQAPPGAHIRVCVPVWEEALLFTGDGSLAPNLHIEGYLPNGAAVLWRPPSGHPADQPLVHISEGAGLTLKGFTLDGDQRVNQLVSLAGPNVGVTLEDLHLRGFRQCGIGLHQCRGSEDRPVTLQRLRLTVEPAASSAVVLEARDGLNNRHIRLLDCRLEGPYQAAIRLSGPARSIELRRNRVHGAVDGILVTRSNLPAPLELTLESNTFCVIQNIGLHFETLPPEQSRVQVLRNRFARTGTLVHVEGFTPEFQARMSQVFAELSGNVRDERAAEGSLPLGAGVQSLPLSTDESDDARFLR